MKSTNKFNLRRRRPRYLLLIPFLMSLLLMLFIPLQANAQEPDVGIESCYALSDEYRDGSDENHNDWLMSLDIPPSPDLPELKKIGPTLTLGAESLSFGPEGRLYTVNKYFGELNVENGHFNQIGTKKLHDVDSLTYDPVANRMFASVRRTGGKADRLIEINPITGNKLDGGVDTDVEIVTDKDDNNHSWYLHDVDALAIEPSTGILYGVLNDNGHRGVLVTINKNDGSVQKIANLIGKNDEGEDVQVEDIEALTFSTDDGEIWTLYAASGDNLDPHPNRNCLVIIDKETGAVSTVYKKLPIDNIIDMEGLTCRYTPPIPQADIDIEQLTNGRDVDEAPGIYLHTDREVTWMFIVRNTGEVKLKEVVVSDNVLGKICTFDELEIGESQTCEKKGVAQEGQFANVTTAIGYPDHDRVVPPEAEEPVSDTDPCHYFGYRPKVNLEKSCEVTPVDELNDPPVGTIGKFTWSYKVTNNGTIALKNLAVTDDPEGAICTIQSLAVGAFHTCTHELTVEEPQVRSNLSTVIGYADAGNALLNRADARVEASDLAECSIEINPPTVEIGKASSFVWQYRVTNVGLVPVDHVGCAMPPGVDVNPKDPAESWVMQPGQFWETTGSCAFGDCIQPFEMHASIVGGTTLASDTMSAMDMIDGLSVKAKVNGLPSSAPTDVAVSVGYPVLWQYEVINNTGVALKNISVQHAVMDSTDGYTDVTCMQNILPAGASTICEIIADAVLGAHSAVGYASGEGEVAHGEHGVPEDQETAASIVSYYTGISQGPATVQGHVFMDLYVNGTDSANGICDPDEPGQGGIGVEIIAESTSVVVASTATDTSGSYELEVPPGEYRLRFVQPGTDPAQWKPWSKLDIGNNNCLDSDVTAGPSMNEALTNPFDLEADEVIIGWDAGLVAKFFANEIYLPFTAHQ